MPKAKSYSGPDKTSVDELVSSYIFDPNCSPELWIANEDVTSEERKEFLDKVSEHYRTKVN